MTGKAHPSDVLILANLAHRIDHLGKFEPNQMFGVSMPLRLRGRRIRKAWIDPRALDKFGWGWMQDELNTHSRFGTEVLSVEDWQPEPLTLVERIAELPEQNASSSRDFGRGYAKAINDALALIGEATAG